jgi:hypothetical protein
MKSQLPTVAVQRQQSQQQLQQQQEQQQEVIMAQSAGGPFYGAEYDGCSGSLPAPVRSTREIALHTMQVWTTSITGNKP